MLVRYLYHGRAPARPKLTAVAELMSAAKKPKPQPTAEDVEPSSTLEKAKNAIAGWDPRNGLGVYINKAETNPEGRVVEYDDDFVVIRDKFPKARYATSEATSRARTIFNSI
jgi:aprataxin